MMLVFHFLFTRFVTFLAQAVWNTLLFRKLFPHFSRLFIVELFLSRF